MSLPSTNPSAARETARQDNGQFGTQPLAEVDTELDFTSDSDVSFDRDYDRAHGLADDVISNLPDVDALHDFLLTNGVPASEIPTDEDDLDEKARDLIHDMAASAVNSGEVDEFVTTWGGGEAPADDGFVITDAQAYEMNRTAARDALDRYSLAVNLGTDDDAARSDLAIAAIAVNSTLRQAPIYDAIPPADRSVVDRLDLALKVANQAELKVEWDAAFAALKESGLEANADDPIAARYREASNTVNHANRKLDWAIGTGQAKSTDPRSAAGQLAESLQNALTVGDNHLRAAQPRA